MPIITKYVLVQCTHELIQMHRKGASASANVKFCDKIKNHWKYSRSLWMYNSWKYYSGSVPNSVHFTPIDCNFLYQNHFLSFCRLNSGNSFATNWITFMSDNAADVTIPAAAVCGLFTQRTTTRSRWNWHRFACMKQMQRSKPRAAVNSTNSVIQNYLSFQMHNHLCVGELSISQSTFYNCSISQYICPLIFK